MRQTAGGNLYILKKKWDKYLSPPKSKSGRRKKKR